MDFWWKVVEDDSEMPRIILESADLIPAAEEKLLLHDTALFEKEQNEGKWISYYDPITKIPSEIPAHFFTWVALDDYYYLGTDMAKDMKIKYQISSVHGLIGIQGNARQACYC